MFATWCKVKNFDSTKSDSAEVYKTRFEKARKSSSLQLLDVKIEMLTAENDW